MSGSFKLVTVFGFDIRVHWSWIFIFLLITWTFSAGILEELFPEWATSTRWATGAAVALVFFLSILFHELSHSVVARRFGIPISSITLFVFGGVSNLGRESDTAKQEFLVAIVGPLTSLGFAVLFGLAALALSPFSEGVAGICLNLGVINLAIAIFNMVPGFPLDGGRVLRSALWARTGSMVRATQLATRAGTGIAYVVMGLGIASFFLLSVISGIWLFLIGNFLRMAAEASYGRTMAENVLSGVPVRRIARQDIRSVGPETTLRDLVDNYMLTGRDRSFPVATDHSFMGVVTLEDAKRVPREDWPSTRVQQAMTPDEKLTTVAPEQDLSRAMQLMSESGADHLAVVDGGEISGFVYRDDLLRYVELRQEVGPEAELSHST